MSIILGHHRTCISLLPSVFERLYCVRNSKKPKVVTDRDPLLSIFTLAKRFRERGHMTWFLIYTFKKKDQRSHHSPPMKITSMIPIQHMYNYPHQKHFQMVLSNLIISPPWWRIYTMVEENLEIQFIQTHKILKAKWFFTMVEEISKYSPS